MPQSISLIERYRAHLPVTAKTPRLTLGEGDTPLVRAPALEKDTGIEEVWLKVEGVNPTGSFKDRGMVVAIAKAMEDGAEAVLCASTGNTAASAAAYAARGRLRCAVVLPAGHVALGKLSQAIAFGARVVAVRGSFDEAVALSRELATGGEGTAVADDEILDAYQFLARCEGVFCEPASAAAFAGLRKLARAGTKPRQVVCVLTGNGMKDPDRAIALAPPIAEVDAELDAVRRAI